MSSQQDESTRIAVFQRKEVRRTLHNNEWWFVIADVVAALTDSADVKSYMRDMRRRDPELDKGWGKISHPLIVPTSGGAQKLNCANTEGLFRIVQAIASPKAEPFKRWLAKVGYDVVHVAHVAAGTADEGVVALANKTGRAILTFDGDLGTLAVQHGVVAQEGIVYFRLMRYKPTTPAEMLLAYLSANPGAELSGRITVFDPPRVRQRRL